MRSNIRWPLIRRPRHRRSVAAPFRRVLSNNGASSASTCASIPSAMAPTVTWTYVGHRNRCGDRQQRSAICARSGRPIAVFVAGVHCVASTFGDDQWFDEVYMLAIGRNHLDWGSADQPPLAPACGHVCQRLAHPTASSGALNPLAAPAALVEQVLVSAASRRSTSMGSSE